MGSSGEALVKPLHVLMFPFMASGHLIPMLDMAKLFACRGVKITIAVTSGNADLVHAAVDGSNETNRYPIELLIIPFPAAAAGLPEGCDRFSSLLVTTQMRHKFFAASNMLRAPYERALRDLLPDCVLSDSFLPWTLDPAAELGIPRLSFHGTSFFSHCAIEVMHRSKPLAALPPGADSFVIPDLPHRIEMLTSQVNDGSRMPPPFVELLREMKESEARSYGVVVNSFRELEPDYVEHFRSALGRRSWAVGPVSLFNKDVADKATRGGDAASAGQDDCLSWLDEKKPGSVIYVSFGSLGRIRAAQLREIAVGLEASGHPFVWVVKSQGGREAEEWMPEGFEESTAGRGMVIRGWAPQILILGHVAVGGFVTHCGWNSSLEGVSAGLPMVTWPMFAEQFYNERLIVDVLRIGVAVGAKTYSLDPTETPLVEAAAVEAAVAKLMDGGEEAEERRRRARELAEQAGWAVEEGGSSYADMGQLITELLDRPTKMVNDQ